MRNLAILYWLITGALLGIGLISILSIGLPLLLTGLILLIAGLIRLRVRNLWALLVGFGGLPALVLILDIITAPPRCTGQPLMVPPGGGSASCGFIPTSYYVFAVVFGLITLAGFAWLWAQQHHASQ
jgi:hypothetical protein